MVDYYYGIGERDDVLAVFLYNASATISPTLGLDMRYALNENWQFISILRYEKFDDGMKNSPLVRKNHVATGFVGFSYGF